MMAVEQRRGHHLEIHLVGEPGRMVERLVAFERFAQGEGRGRRCSRSGVGRAWGWAEVRVQALREVAAGDDRRPSGAVHPGTCSTPGPERPTAIAQILRWGYLQRRPHRPPLPARAPLPPPAPPRGAGCARSSSSSARSRSRVRWAPPSWPGRRCPIPTAWAERLALIDYLQQTFKAAPAQGATLEDLSALSWRRSAQGPRPPRARARSCLPRTASRACAA